MEGKESEQKELGNHLELAIKISRGIVKSRSCEVAEFFLTRTDFERFGMKTVRVLSSRRMLEMMSEWAALSSLRMNQSPLWTAVVMEPSFQWSR